MYCSAKSDIFRHAYQGMAILHFINTSDFSSLPQASPGQVVYLGCSLFHRGEMNFRRPQGRRRAEGEREERRPEHAVSERRLGSGGVSCAVAPLEGIWNRREGGLRAQSLGYGYARGRGRVG